MVHDPVEIVYNAAGLSENTSQARDGSGKDSKRVEFERVGYNSSLYY
jgi:hypothetical protein